MAQKQAATKQCPQCAETIKLEALVCHYCRQEFTVKRVGYCADCHEQVVVESGTVCPTCGKEVIDITVRSEPKLATPPPPAPAQPAAVAPAAAALVVPKGGVSESQRIAAGAGFAALGGGLVILSSFLPWFGYRGVTKTGWDLFTTRADADQDVFFIGNMFASFSPVFTGLTTLALGIAALVVTLIVVVSPRPPLTSRHSVSMAVVVLVALALVPLMLIPMVNLFSYLADGQQLHYSLEVGVPLTLGGALVSCASLTTAINRPAWMWHKG